MDGMFTWSNLWGFVTGTLWPLLEVLIALSVVILVHELGHFLAARIVGIKVERFALWIGPKLIGIKPGETEYCICAFPIGGYVKMLGQEDFAPREEGDDATADGENDVDPRSYNAKSPGQRIFVISMGVVMNIILAALLFMGLSMYGIDEPAPVIGEVAPAYPASRAVIAWDRRPPAGPQDEDVDRLRSGDTITALDGTVVESFKSIRMASALADHGEEFAATVRRTVGGEEYTGSVTLTAVKLPGAEAPAFGIAQEDGSVVAEIPDHRVSCPFHPGDRIVSIDGTEIAAARHEIIAAEEHLSDTSPVDVVVERGGTRVTLTVRPTPVFKPTVHVLADGTRLRGRFLDTTEYTGPAGTKYIADEDEFLFLGEDGAVQTVNAADIAGGATVQKTAFLGMEPRVRIRSVIESSLFSRSAAAAAGIEPGDVIIEYAGRKHPTFETIREVTNEFAGKTTSMTVLRREHGGRYIEKTIDNITPATQDGGGLLGITQGLDMTHAVVAAVAEYSPAAKAGIEAGSTIIAVNGRKVGGWREVYDALVRVRKSGAALNLSWEFGGEKFGPAPVDIASFDPDEYRLSVVSTTALERMTVEIRHTNPLAALGWGARETAMFVVNSYASIRSIVTGSVSTRQVRGPVGIVTMAVGVASHGLVGLIYMMAFISTALAVFNFLPLPVLDGGHAALLLIEKIRGRPLPLKVINAIQMTGVVLILSLLILVTIQDCSRFF